MNDDELLDEKCRGHLPREIIELIIPDVATRRSLSRRMCAEADEACNKITVWSSERDIPPAMRTFETLARKIARGHGAMKLKIRWDSQFSNALDCIQDAIEHSTLGPRIVAVDVIGRSEREIRSFGCTFDMTPLAHKAWAQSVVSVSFSDNAIEQCDVYDPVVISDAAMPNLERLDLTGCVLDGALLDLSDRLWPKLDALHLELCRAPSQLAMKALPCGSVLRHLRISGQSKRKPMHLPDRVDMSGCERLDVIDMDSCIGLRELVLPPRSSIVWLSQCPDLVALEGLDRETTNDLELFLQECPSLTTGLDCIRRPLSDMIMHFCDSIPGVIRIWAPDRLECVEISECARLGGLTVGRQNDDEAPLLESVCIVHCKSLSELHLPHRCPRLSTLQAQWCPVLHRMDLPRLLSPELDLSIRVDRQS